MSGSVLSPIEDALAALAHGKLIIVVDDEDRENEGDYIGGAQFATPEMINFLATEGRGLICASFYPERGDQLELRVPDRARALHGTAFTDSVDLVLGTTTGISAADRSATFMALADPQTKPSDLARPGHVFPLVARRGGVLERRGHTEATADLCRLAGLHPVGVLCEILNPDGTMARLPQLVKIAQQHQMPLISVEQLVQWRRTNETQVTEQETVDLPTAWGDFKMSIFASEGKQSPLALKRDEGSEMAGNPGAAELLPLVRIHSECLTGDVFSSARCDCGEQLDRSLEMISGEAKGALIYLRQEGRGIGLEAKLKAYKLQQTGLDTWDANTLQGLPADAREYWEAAQILRQWGWTRIRLLTNNPAKVAGLERYGIQVQERLPLEIAAGKHNSGYLQTKRRRFGHFLNF